jgi:hypothetical protein
MIYTRSGVIFWSFVFTQAGEARVYQSDDLACHIISMKTATCIDIYNKIEAEIARSSQLSNPIRVDDTDRPSQNTKYVCCATLLLLGGTRRRYGPAL